MPAIQNIAIKPADAAITNTSEATLRQNAASFERCDLVPNVLRGVGTIDISVTVMGQKLAMPVYCSPTALQRLFHHQGERASRGAKVVPYAANPNQHRSRFTACGGSSFW